MSTNFSRNDVCRFCEKGARRMWAVSGSVIGRLARLWRGAPKGCGCDACGSGLTTGRGRTWSDIIVLIAILSLFANWNPVSVLLRNANECRVRINPNPEGNVYCWPASDFVPHENRHQRYVSNEILTSTDGISMIDETHRGHR